LISFSVAKL